MKDILLLGGGGHAQTIISIMSEEQRSKLLGYLDISDKGELLKVPYLGNDDFLNGKQNTLSLIVGLSYMGSKVNLLPRLNLVTRCSALGFRFETVISEKSIIHNNVQIDEGTVVFPGAIINQGVSIGKNCLINSGAIIEHNCLIHDNVQISPGSIVCGGTEIYNNSFIGAGSVIRDGIIIGPDIIIGMGSNVTKSVFDQGTYFTKRCL